MSKKYSYKEVKEFIENLGYKLLDDNYVDRYKPLTIRDNDGYFYFVCFNNLMYTNQIPSKFHQSNPYTIQNVKLWCKLNNKPFELLSDKYEGNNKKLKWKCLKPECREIFEATWSNVQNGRGCSVCVGRQVNLSNCLATKNPQLASEWHPTKNGELTPYDVTPFSHKKVWWQCKDNSEHEWKAVISNRNLGNGCLYCSHQLPSKNYNLLICNPELCEEWDYNKNKKSPIEYNPNTHAKVWWICKKCGYEWESVIGSRNKGIGCPRCVESKGEIKIDSWLKINNVYNEPQKTFEGLIGLGNGLLSYDFYLPDYNLLIEYQGEFHDGNGNYYMRKNLKKQEEHDYRKREYAKEQRIKLLELWYYDFDNIEIILQRELGMSKDFSV